jgi:hypothetical protein
MLSIDRGRSRRGGERDLIIRVTGLSQECHTGLTRVSTNNGYVCRVAFMVLGSYAYGLKVL